MEGVRELGNVVCTHIASLQNELRSLRKEPIVDSTEEQQQAAHSSTDGQDTDKPFKGTLMDRYFSIEFIFSFIY
jgi:hypothetical protein